MIYLEGPGNLSSYLENNCDIRQDEKLEREKQINKTVLTQSNESYTKISLYDEYHKEQAPVLQHPELEKTYINTDFLNQLEQSNQKLLPFVRNIVNQTFIFQNYKLTNRMCEDIGKILMQKSELNRLILIDNELSDDSAALLLGMIFGKRIIKTIRYVKNEIGPLLTEVIQKDLFVSGEDLIEFTIDSCKCKQIYLEKILETFITRRTRLKHLGTANLRLNKHSVNLITEFLKGAEYLQSLDISWNMIRCDHLVPLIFSLRCSANLQYLNLSWNQLSDKDSRNSKNLREFLLYQKSILHLDLSYTGLNEQEVSIIVNGVKWSSSLVAIHLTGNRISPQSEQKIQEFLSENIPRTSSPPDCSDINSDCFHAFTTTHTNFECASKFSLYLFFNVDRGQFSDSWHHREQAEPNRARRTGRCPISQSLP